MMRIISVLFLLCLGYSVCSADEFELRNGGTVTGTLLNPAESPRQEYRIRLDKGGEVTLDVGDVSQHVIPTPEQRKYQELLAKLPRESAEMHWKMAEQCRKWSLLRERKFHLEQTVRLEPNHEQARRALRHKQRADGTWAELSQIMAEQGKVRRSGRWVSKQEAAMLDAQSAREEAENEWKKKLRLWRRWLTSGQQGQVLRELEAIDDPAAMSTIIELFRSPPGSQDTVFAVREVLAELLAKSGRSDAVRILVEAAMTGSRDLQMECLRQLEKHGHAGAVVGQFLPHLQSERNQLVRRAGYALGVLGGDEVVLPLIRALRTTHTFLVGGAGDGRINLRNGGLSAGQTKPKKVTQAKSNREVRSALVKLTGADFEYDEQQWLRWYARRATPPNLDLRRDE